MKKIVFMIIGIGLITGLLLTSQKGLSLQTIQLYEDAIDLNDYVASEVWTGFRIEDYPVAIRQGDIEYVFHHSSRTERAPHLEHIALTAQPVDNVYNIFMLSKEEMDQLAGFVEGVGDDMYVFKQFGLQQETMSGAAYIALLYHEGFHAYQFSNYYDNIFKWYQVEDDLDEDKAFEIMNSTEFTQNYIDEGAILYEVFQANDQSSLIDIAKDYIEVRESRLEQLERLLNKQEYLTYTSIENYYEVVEGTADYICVQVLIHLSDDETLTKFYDSVLNNDKIGYKKFYESGMAICILLDKLNIQWQDRLFDQQMTPYEILKDYLEDL